MPAALSIQQEPFSATCHTFLPLRDYLTSRVLGQKKLVERLLVALRAHGHLLVEGPPALAKTRAIKALAQSLVEVKIDIFEDAGHRGRSDVIGMVTVTARP